MTTTLATKDAVHLALPPIADLAYAPQLKLALLQALDAGLGIEIDAKDVQRITTPCLQILAAGAGSFAAVGGAKFAFSKVSRAFADTAEILAVSPTIGIVGE